MKDGILQIFTDQTKPLVVRLVDDAGEPLELGAWQVYGGERTTQGEVIMWQSRMTGPDTVQFFIPALQMGGMRDCDVWIKSPAGVEACLWSGRVCRLPRVATNCPAMGEAATITATITTRGDALEVALTADVLFTALELQEFEDKLKTATQEAGKTVEASRTVATAAGQVAEHAQEAQASADRAAEAHVAAEAARGEAEAVATEAAHTLDTSAAAHLARVEASASEGVAAVNSAATVGTEEVRAAQATGVSAVEQATDSGCALVRDTAAELAGDTALLSRDNAFSGNNSHAGVETYNGPVACNAPLLLDGSELRTILADSIVLQSFRTLALDSYTIRERVKKLKYNCSTSPDINTSWENGSSGFENCVLDDPSIPAYKALIYHMLSNDCKSYSNVGFAWGPRFRHFAGLCYGDDIDLLNEHVSAVAAGTLDPQQIPPGKVFLHMPWNENITYAYACTGKYRLDGSQQGYILGVIACGTSACIFLSQNGWGIANRWKIETKAQMLSTWMASYMTCGVYKRSPEDIVYQSTISFAPLGSGAGMITRYPFLA